MACRCSLADIAEGLVKKDPAQRLESHRALTLLRDIQAKLRVSGGTDT
jgi:hypothetical protein